jgi:cysteinyl-tRNA synthetase
VTVQLYDTKTQTLRDFVPLDPGNVTIYVCGPTVQSGPHIGHLRGALSFDILRRWLTHRHGRVTFVRNVTDIDDKVLANAADGEPWWALAYRMELEFTRAYSAIGILPPTYEPRATASIPQMQELIARLIDAGHAYAAPSTGSATGAAGAGTETGAAGDVYFDVRSWAEYGSLTRQSLDAMEPAADADPRGKRDPRDFALWKGAKADEPASATWESPWGPGRPGWHIECSAMARRYLGSEFDIHGGGLDLRFPHHENELAQSTAAGDGFARYWVHNGLVTVGAQKMSKSLFNFILAEDVLRERDPLVVRYALAAAHYRSSLDITTTTFDEAEAAVDRIRTFLERAVRALRGADDVRVAATVPAAFAAALDDDLGVPQALAVLHETVREGNTALDGGDRDGTMRAFAAVAVMTGVLGIDPLDPHWRSTDASDQTRALDALVQTMIAQRADARAAKDWAAADRIRDAIAAAGIALEDGPDGTHWSVADVPRRATDGAAPRMKEN